jgi:general stress protein 26
MKSYAGSDGTIHSRPMATLEADEANFQRVLWFFSKRNSAKNYELRNDQHVNLAYANPDKHQYVSISGQAFISTDQSKILEVKH